MGIVAAALLAAAFKRVQHDMLIHELAGRAELLAAVIEEDVPNYLSDTELLQTALALSRETIGVQDIGLVNMRSGRVLSASKTAWEGKHYTQLDSLKPLLAGDYHWSLGAGVYGFAQPIDVSRDTRVESTTDYRLVVTMESEAIYDAHVFSLLLLSASAFVLALAMIVGVALLMRRHVLEPVALIHEAIRRREQSGALTRDLCGIDSEIGALAETLWHSWERIDAQDEEVDLLSLAIANCSTEMYVIDPNDMSVLYTNQAVADNLGYEQEELVGMRVPEFAPAATDEVFLASLRDAFRRREEFRHIYQHVRKDGTQYPCEFVGVYLTQSNGAKIVVTGNDVTERQAQEQALRDSEERLRIATQGANEGVFDWDLESDALYLSRVARQWWSIGEGSSAADQVLERVLADDVPKVLGRLEATVKQGVDLSVEFRIRPPSGGGVMWIQARGRGVQDAQMRTVRVSGFVTDVTHRKVTEHLLKDTVSRLGGVLDNVADGIVTLTERGDVCSVNRAAERILGCGKDRLIESPMNLWVHVQQPWEQLADGETRELQGVRADGTGFFAEVGVRALNIGTDERYTVIVRDVTERKTAGTGSASRD